MRPVYLTHKEWCRHLQNMGLLDDSHRVCLRAETCIAGRVGKKS